MGTFQVDASLITVGTGMYVGGGFVGGADALPMTDEDEDGIWEAIFTVQDGTAGNYAFFNSPTHGGDWGTKENLGGQDCADADNYDDRLLDPVTEDTTLTFCFATCDETCPDPNSIVYHNVTFQVDASLITVGTGMYVGGGFVGGADALPM